MVKLGYMPVSDLAKKIIKISYITKVRTEYA